MFPAGIYYVQTRGLPCLYEQTCLSNSVCPLYVQTRGCASSVRDIGGKSMIIAVQRCSGEVKQTHHKQYLTPAVQDHFL